MVCLFGILKAPAQVEESIKKMFQSAQEGNPESQTALGEYYCFMSTPNYSEAVKWYRKAAEQGYADAINALKKIGL